MSMNRKIKLCPLINSDCQRLGCEWWCENEEFIGSNGYCSIKGISLFANVACQQQNKSLIYLKMLSRSVDELWNYWTTKKLS